MRYIQARNKNYQVRFVRMAFTKARKRTLLIPPLTNISCYDLEVCLAHKCSGTTLEEMASNQIANIFASKFNCDITDSFDDYYEITYDDYDVDDFSGIDKYFEKWQKKTKANPDWVPKKFKEFENYEDKFYDWHSDSE